jgi:hypothetical protein
MAKVFPFPGGPSGSVPSLDCSVFEEGASFTGKARRNKGFCAVRRFCPFSAYFFARVMASTISFSAKAASCQSPILVYLLGSRSL